MKNDNNHQIKQGREQQLNKAAYSDVLVIPEVVEENIRRLSEQPKRKRRINYAKKIMNDPFIMGC